MATTRCCLLEVRAYVTKIIQLLHRDVAQDPSRFGRALEAVQAGSKRPWEGIMRASHLEAS